MLHAIHKALSLAASVDLTARNLCIGALLLAIVWFRPRWFRAMMGVADRLLGGLAKRPVVTILVAALFPLIVRLMILPAMPIPVPRIHDEFSYLLAADTFAHGRVTNPPHPLWQFFETFHVLPQPTYMSKYPPAQAIFMAAGQVLFGNPWWGVFLSVGIMCGAACWMLLAWAPPIWALLGALTIGTQFGITHYWMNSYWGGAPGAIGGCLVLGALGRIIGLRRHRASFLDACLFALGAVILLNSRPWEGLAILIPSGLVLLHWLLKDRELPPSRKLVTVVVPMGALLAVGASAMLYYNWRITGSALELPYRATHKFYSVTPLFVWEKRTPAPEYHHAVMRRFYLDIEPRYQAADTLGTLRGWAPIEKDRLDISKGLLFGNFFLLLAVAAGLTLIRKPGIRLLLAVLAAFMVALSLECWCQIHYFGPVIAAAVAIKIASLRWLSAFKLQGRRVGQALMAAIVVSSAVALIQHARADHPSTTPFQFQRAAIERRLEATSGKHVVLVRYSDTHNPIQEWVYNRADIDGEKVIWARAMSDAQNQRLINYYRDRNIWLLQPDVSPTQLQPYSASRLNVTESAQTDSAGLVSTNSGNATWK